MKRLFVIFTLLVLLCGCGKFDNTEPPSATSATTISWSVISEAIDQMTLIMSKYGDCQIFLCEKDGLLTASLDLECFIQKVTFYDYIIAFIPLVNSFAEENELRIESLHVGFIQNGATASYILVWDSSDGLSGSLVDTTEDGRVVRSCTPADIKEYYGSAELDFS